MTPPRVGAHAGAAPRTTAASWLPCTATAPAHQVDDDVHDLLPARNRRNHPATPRHRDALPARMRQHGLGTAPAVGVQVGDQAVRIAVLPGIS